MKQTIYIVALLMGLSGCISDFTPNDLEEVNGLLIIDGTITDGESVFKLSHSVGLSEELTGNETISHASLYVESEDGRKMNGVLKKTGEYVVRTGDLNPDTRYRLHVSVDGEEYESTYLSPLLTPEIDSLAPLKKGQGEPVFMCVNTHDPSDQSRFYRWTYKEDWEVKAELYANAHIGEDGAPVLHDLSTSNNFYYCWGRDSSKVLLLGSTDKLSENLIYQHKLVEMPCNSAKISNLYYIYVEQMQIRKETYDYMLNMQKNIEQTGGIFSPVPSEMRGNIDCTTNPSLRAIGYIEVATTTRKDLFVPATSGLYEPPTQRCSYQITNDPDLAYPVYAYFFYDTSVIMPEHMYAPYDCVDCRQRYNATKNRPAFWPNDHY